VNDFAQVAAASVWNMRWQVKGFFAEAGYYEDSSRRPRQADLKARFLAGSGLKRLNFRGLIDGQSWSVQLGILADMTLVNFISLYEGWAASIAEEANLSRNHGDALQWPSLAVYPRKIKGAAGVAEVLASAQTPRSTVMDECFYPRMLENRHYSKDHLDSLLVCYRYWKELRNCIAHNGGRPSVRLGEDADRLRKIDTSDFPVKIPVLANEHPAERLYVDLHQVLGVAEIIHRIVVTIDAELAVSSAGENVMIDQWERFRRPYSASRNPSKSPEKRASLLARSMSAAGLPPPVHLEQLDNYISQRYGNQWRVA
jgi:hypothetical protein